MVGFEYTISQDQFEKRYVHVLDMAHGKVYVIRGGRKIFYKLYDWLRHLVEHLDDLNKIDCLFGRQVHDSNAHDIKWDWTNEVFLFIFDQLCLDELPWFEEVGHEKYWSVQGNNKTNPTQTAHNMSVRVKQPVLCNNNNSNQVFGNSISNAQQQLQGCIPDKETVVRSGHQDSGDGNETDNTAIGDGRAGITRHNVKETMQQGVAGSVGVKDNTAIGDGRAGVTVQKSDGEAYTVLETPRDIKPNIISNNNNETIQQGVAGPVGVTESDAEAYTVMETSRDLKPNISSISNYSNINNESYSQTTGVIDSDNLHDNDTNSSNVHWANPVKLKGGRGTVNYSRSKSAQPKRGVKKKQSRYLLSQKFQNPNWYKSVMNVVTPCAASSPSSRRLRAVAFEPLPSSVTFVPSPSSVSFEPG